MITFRSDVPFSAYYIRAHMIYWPALKNLKSLSFNKKKERKKDKAYYRHTVIKSSGTGKTLDI